MKTSFTDLETVCQNLAEGIPVDPELQQKAIEIADQIREELGKRHGLLNVAVDLIREAREE